MNSNCGECGTTLLTEPNCQTCIDKRFEALEEKVDKLKDRIRSVEHWGHIDYKNLEKNLKPAEDMTQHEIDVAARRQIKINMGLE